MTKETKLYYKLVVTILIAIKHSLKTFSNLVFSINASGGVISVLIITPVLIFVPNPAFLIYLDHFYNYKPNKFQLTIN